MFRKRLIIGLLCAACGAQAQNPGTTDSSHLAPDSAGLLSPVPDSTMPDADICFLRISPSHFHDYTEITFYANTGKSIHLDLYDEDGRFVQGIMSMSAIRTEQKILISGGWTLPPGNYVMVLRSRDQRCEASLTLE